MTDKKHHKVNFADCYVLTNKRTKEFIMSFLNKYIPNRKEYTDVYEVPQFAEDPVLVFKSADELIEYLEHSKHEVHAIYWYNEVEEILRGTMCLFTSDGQVIVGIFCESLFPDNSIEEKYFNDLKEFCGSNIGLIEYETPAAKDTDDFLRRVNEYMQNKDSR
ncbi:hypothetical protein OCK74_17815 [Chitinophagaceae bacterium LB-8]|uniref:Uncharacterized protein n=1 Tax=Paraflavisolibacter caeni TaxID=2982496 RepID=A0A9X2XXM3_9BACT|nr:hypothetical protein [Paraflavisolibacter caeni]MCU7550980.1 hypothetical protein [Paraflavisolibacter caeni]